MTEVFVYAHRIILVRGVVKILGSIAAGLMLCIGSVGQAGASELTPACQTPEQAIHEAGFVHRSMLDECEHLSTADFAFRAEFRVGKNGHSSH